MLRTCNNLSCNKDISLKQKIAKFCSVYCYDKTYRENNREKFKRYDKKRYLKHSEEIKARVKKYRINNKEKAYKARDLWTLLNRDYVLKKSKEKYQNNKEYYKFQVAKRRATQMSATPKFADLNKIKDIYKNCPKGYEVDHIVPLRSNIVCGLHVHWNLQYLTIKENRSKGNKLWHS